VLFFVEVSQDHIKKERAKARQIRQSTWWKKRCSEGRCFYCNSEVNPKELTMDHIVPIIRGGRSTKNNIVPACKDCNSKKKYLLPIEWQEYLDSLN
jgi:5-methylcytosine-specific restriction endonuclease McrA